MLKVQKKNYYRLFKKYRKIDELLRLFINVCNAVTLCSIIVVFSSHNWVLWVSLSCSSLSTIVGAIYSTINLPTKIQSSNTSYLQLQDLYNSYHNELLKSHLTNSDYDIILSELNIKSGLIYDSSLPISQSRDDDSMSN